MSAAAATPAIPRASWHGLGVLFLVYGCNMIDRQILSILANDIKADLDIGDAQLGFLYGTAFAIFYALFGVPLGRIADRVNRVRLLGAGLTLWSGMTLLSGLARDFTQLALARIGVGVGEASANPCAYGLIAEWFPARLRATALSLYTSGLFLGSGLSLVLGGAVVEWWNASWPPGTPQGAPLGLAGWQAAFVAVGLPGLGLTLWVLALRDPRPAQARGGGSVWRGLAGIVPPFTLLLAARRGAGALAANLALASGLALLAWGLAAGLGNPAQWALLALGFYATASWATGLRAADRACFALTFANPAFIAIVLAYAAISYTGYTVTYWAAPYAERTFALGKTELGWLIGAPNAVGGFLGVIAGGWSADRLLRRRADGRLLVLLAGLLGPLPLVLVGYGTASLELFLLCNFAVQIATSSALGAAAAASQALVRPEMRGTAAAIFLLGPTLIGLGFGPFAAGAISEATGDLAMGVRASLIAVIPGMAAWWLARRPRRQAL